MVFYCVVPGCKTNRKGYLKLSLFSIPKDDERKKKWEEAISINDLQRTRHRVCEKHFNPEDIIRSTEHRDSEGNIIAVLPLQCYKLTYDAVPSLQYGNNCEKVDNTKKCDVVSVQNAFENVFSDITNQISSTDNDNHESLTVEIVDDLSSIQNYSKVIEIKNVEHNSLVKKSGSSNSSELTSNFIVVSKNCDKSSIDNSSKTKKIETNQIITEKEKIFTLLCENINLIKLQTDWIIHVPANKDCIAIAEINVGRYGDEGYSSICIIKRSLVVNKSMKISYSAFGKTLDSEQLNLNDQFENFEELQTSFNKFSNLVFCSGIGDIHGVELVKDNVGYTDSYNKLRHNNCQILCLRRKCKMCDNVRKTVCQKKRRMSRRDPCKKRDTYSNLADKNVLQNWKKRIQAQKSVIKRAKNKIERLRNQISEMKTGLGDMDIQAVLDKCSEYNIPEIQRTLIEQIVASAKVKSEKGRRYSEDWTMLCILMHTRSPKEYKHLQSLGILPLPCVRTVRRYLALLNQFDSEESLEKAVETDFEEFEDIDQNIRNASTDEDVEDNAA